MTPRSTLVAILALLLAATPAAAADFTVNSFGDQADANPGNGACATSTGTCTLRAAIQEANARPGLDYVFFSIGVGSLSPASAYPTITDDLVIDGTTSPGYVESGSAPLWRPPAIYLDGFGLGGSTIDGLRATGTADDPINVEIRGLGIAAFPRNGINITFGKNVLLDANWVGIYRNGETNTWGNGANGVVLTGCEDCIIGAIAFEVLGTPVKVGLGNAISGNADAGLVMGFGNNNLIGSNEIGPVPGSAEFIYSSGGGNGGPGINLLENDTRIGQFLSVAVNTRNIVLYNGGHGVSAGGNRLSFEYNWISANGGDGLVLTGDDHVVQALHQIASNGGVGVRLGTTGASADNALLDDALVVGHATNVLVERGSGIRVTNNRIDGATTAAVDVRAENTIIQDNRIGGVLNPPPPLALGIRVVADDVDVVGNTVLGATGPGIRVEGASARVEQNLVGADATGMVRGNNVGIHVQGPTADVRLNVVVGSGGDGIILQSTGTLVCGNRIGELEPGTPAPNGIAGIWLTGHDNFIGDYPPAPHYCSGNEISYNQGPGIEVEGLHNRIASNAMMNNQQAGVLLRNGAARNFLLANHFLGYGGTSVLLESSAGTENRVERSAFHGDNLAIDLGGDGPTPNDSNDADEGTNRLMNHPEIIAVFSGPGSVQVTSRIDIAPTSASFPVRLYLYTEVDGTWFRLPAAEDQFELLGPTQITTTVPVGDGPADRIVYAMAIDADGNSSELGPGMAFTAMPIGDQVFADGFED